MRDSQAVIEFKQLLLEQTEIIDKPGKALYSSGTTLKPGPLYFIGTKPGGTLPRTIRQSLNDLDTDLNEYLDVSWEDRPPGQQKMQKQVIRTLKGLGFDTRLVPASNIVLTRDRSIDSHPDLDGDAKRCWIVHKFILSIVQPKNILAYGSGEEKSPFSYLRDFLTPQHIETINAGQKPFSCHRFQATIDGRDVGVIAIPHLSRYSPYTKPDIMSWIKEWL
jgi:hypothetical protein